MHEAIDDQPDDGRHHGHTHNEHHDHGQHGHGGHQHGHANDQGLSGALRYLRLLPRLWRSAINDAAMSIVVPGRGERIVDIGAGMGAGAIPMARSGATVVAVEPTPFLRRILRLRRAASRCRSRLEVVDGTAEQIPVPDRSVDAVVAVNTMHHWVEPERGVAEAVRVLRPGGRLVLIDEDFSDPTHPDHERWMSRHGDGADGHRHRFSMVDAEKLGALAAEAGAEEVEAGARIIDGIPTLTITGARTPDSTGQR